MPTQHPRQWGGRNHQRRHRAQPASGSERTSDAGILGSLAVSGNSRDYSVFALRHRWAAASTLSAARTLDVSSIQVRYEEKEMRKFRKDPDAIARLSQEQYRVTQQNGTEAPGSG